MSTGTRVYVDMVGDLFHAGHVALLREAHRHGDVLIVGVLSDDVAASYKRRPVMSLAERVAVIEACRHVDQVVPDAPSRLDAGFVAEHAIDVVVHGDDISIEVARDLYGIAPRLELVPREPGLSTTEVIQRILTRSAGVEHAPDS